MATTPGWIRSWVPRWGPFLTHPLEVKILVLLHLQRLEQLHQVLARCEFRADCTLSVVDKQQHAIAPGLFAAPEQSSLSKMLKKHTPHALVNL